MRTVTFLIAWIGVLSLPYLFLNRLADTSLAFAHGVRLLELDGVLGVPLGVYGLLSGPFWTGVYEYPHLALMMGLVPFLFVFRPCYVWQAFVEMTIVFLACDLVWLVWPSAPPWMVLHVGAMPLRSGVAQFASFPSFHIVVAAMVARYGGRLGGVYAVLMFLVVVLTGNHYVVDCVVGWLVEWLSYRVVRWLSGEWSRRRGRARATLAARAGLPARVVVEGEVI